MSIAVPTSKLHIVRLDADDIVEAIDRCADNIEYLDKTVKELVEWLKGAQFVAIQHKE